MLCLLGKILQNIYISVCMHDFALLWLAEEGLSQLIFILQAVKSKKSFFKEPNMIFSGRVGIDFSIKMTTNKNVAFEFWKD